MSLIDNDLVVQSLNFHGNNLTAFLKNYPEFQDLDLKHVNYGIYQSRSKELRTEDRGQRLLLHQFISQNLLPIFRFVTLSFLDQWYLHFVFFSKENKKIRRAI